LSKLTWSMFLGSSIMCEDISCGIVLLTQPAFGISNFLSLDFVSYSHSLFQKFSVAKAASSNQKRLKSRASP